jgi:hypothetical protein
MNRLWTLSNPLLVVSLFLSLVTSVHADPIPPFPADPAAWVNSGPLSASSLKGKGIVLWFFEEDDQGSAARWRTTVEEVKKFEGRPVIFIAVNSGSPRQKIEAYVRQVGGKWPVIVDQSRDFESACGLFQEIDTKNVSQFRYITPDGEMHTPVKDEIKEIAELAEEGAAWKIDPTNIPDPLKQTWFAVEIGNYKGLAANLKKSTSSPKAETKEAATKLMELVQQEIDAQMAKIKEAQDASNTFKTHELLSELLDRFNGFELPKETATMKKDLAKDAKVKAGMLAQKSLEQERKKLAVGNPAAKAKSITALEKIVNDFPETSLARHAQSLIDAAQK